MTGWKTVLEDEHFRLDRLADGIYAAIATLEGGAMGNAGIVDLGDQTLVFDTFLTRAAAAELRAAAEELTGRAPRYLVISHGHGDHVWGNSIFLPEASVLSSAGTAAMVTAEERASIDPEDLVAELAELEKSHQEATDEAVRLSIVADLHSKRWLLEELPLLVVPPAVTFDDRVWISGTKKSVSLDVVAKAHTAGDVYLHCPEEGVIFLGDLGFFSEFPAYIAPQGNAAAWARTLRHLEVLDVDRFVPGHGPIGDAENLRTQRAFLDAVVDVAGKVAEAGGTVEDAVERMRQTNYSRWTTLPLVVSSLQSALEQVDGGNRLPRKAGAG
jgi:cyclase